MSRKQRPRGLRAALVSYDERQLRVWSRYLEEQSAGLVCRCCQSGEELLTLLRQGEQIDVVVLGGTLADMDELAFVEQISRLHAKPFLLLPDDGRHRAGAGASLGPGNACYLIRQTSLRDLLRRLQELPNDPEERIVQFCGECYDRWGVAQPDVNCTYLTQAVCSRWRSGTRPPLPPLTAACGGSLSVWKSGVLWGGWRSSGMQIFPECGSPPASSFMPSRGHWNEVKNWIPD